MLHDVVVSGLKVDEVIGFQKIEPGAVDEMADRGWVLPDGFCRPTHPFPDLFPRRRGQVRLSQGA